MRDHYKTGPMLVIPKRTKVLFIFGDEYRPFLVALKKEIVSTLGNKSPHYQIDFASSSGLTKETLDAAAKSYDYVGVACPATATFICPDGISFHDAAGSLYGNKFLILSDPQHIFTVPYGAFLLRRYLSKIFSPESWVLFPEFTWRRLDTPENFEAFYALAQTAVFIAVDIETIRKHNAIDCVGFALLGADGSITTGVLDCADDNFFARLRKLLAAPVPKTFQSGLYDNQYFLRWNSPCDNWVHDTSYFFHSWYAEMEKDLGFLAGFFIRNFEYWKQENRKAQSKEDRHRYNAKDAYATLCIAIAQLTEAPGWVRQNFTINFPRVFPCLYMSLHGLRVNEDIRASVAAERAEILAREEKSLQIMTSVEAFNAGSPQQVAKLFQVFGITTKTGEKELLNLGTKHPLLQRFTEKILAVREQKKAISSYLNPSAPDKLTDGRLMYKVDPCGTETGRMASQKSSFWGGIQIQNQPPYAKCYIEADTTECANGEAAISWVFGEIDNEQSESRTTAYLAEDESLIATLESGRDFHSTNAVKFFGADYETTKKRMEDGSDSPLRALAKRINHAVSYNMGPAMFVFQAGGPMMELARRELKLPIHMNHLQIAEYLIALFDRSYPKVRHAFQDGVKREISFTKKLVGATGWTRYFFSDPSLSKPALNAAVAHGPQSLSVQIINDGLMRIWTELVLAGEPVRILAQIHDSIFFQVPVGRKEELFAKVKNCMNNAVTVRGRVLLIPTAMKDCGQFWAKRKRAAT